MDTKRKGNMTEIFCIYDLIKHGCTVSTPYGDNALYDLIADYNGHLLRIQVKTSSLLEGALYIPCRRSQRTYHKSSHQTYTSSDIDYIMTAYNYETYLIPVTECNTSKTLRLSQAKNNQVVNISNAADYLLETHLNKLK